MKRRILGFQRRVWWPKCTPASSSSLMPTEATVLLPCRLVWYCRSGGFAIPAAALMRRAGQGRDPGPNRVVFRLATESTRLFALVSGVAGVVGGTRRYPLPLPPGCRGAADRPSLPLPPVDRSAPFKSE